MPEAVVPRRACSRPVENVSPGEKRGCHKCFCRGCRTGYALERSVASSKPVPGKDFASTDPKSGTRPAELQGDVDVIGVSAVVHVLGIL